MEGTPLHPPNRHSWVDSVRALWVSEQPPRRTQFELEVNHRMETENSFQSHSIVGYNYPQRGMHNMTGSQAIQFNWYKNSNGTTVQRLQLSNRANCTTIQLQQQFKGYNS